MSDVEFRQVDVFGSAPFSGNPLAVVADADGLTTDDMVRITRWTNLSEATFLLPPTVDGADYRVRIFTQVGELPFAGHPTLGSCAAWLDAGGVPAVDGVIVQECGAGLVTIRNSGSTSAPMLAFAAPPMTRHEPVDEADLGEALRMLGLGAADVVASHWIDNGPGWMGLQLRDAAAVLALEVPAERAMHFDVGVVGLHPSGGDCDVEVRAFFNDSTGAIREDPVTGSLNASVGQWLLGAGTLTSPYVAAQGTAMGRRGRVHVELADGDVWVGGATDVCIKGVINLPS